MGVVGKKTTLVTIFSKNTCAPKKPPIMHTSRRNEANNLALNG